MSKMIKCKTCGADIAKSAKVCPHCGAKNKKKHNIIGSIFLVLGIVLIISALFGSDDSSSPNSDKPVTKSETETSSNSSVSDSAPDKSSQDESAPLDNEAPIELSAHDLWAAYDENEVNADNLYKKKTISVTGTVFEIGKDLLTGTPFIALKAGDSLGIYNIQCFFQDSSEHDKVAKVRDGDTITIVGKCEGKSINVLLRDCSLPD